MTKKPTVDPAKDVKFDSSLSNFSTYFIGAKTGVTEESLVAQGCRSAMYLRVHRVFVWPIIGPDLNTDVPIGFVVMDYSARENLPVRDRDGKVRDYVDKKLTWRSKPGLIGADAITKLKSPDQIETVWKVEGITDQLALWAAIPGELRDKHAVITTSNGAGESPDWRADLLAQFNVNIVHDCDVSGQEGALEWANYIARRQPAGKVTRNIVLPFEIVADHGCDLRDFLNGKNV